MRASIILAALCAATTIASPIQKKAVVTEIVTDYVYVWVTTEGVAIAKPTEGAASEASSTAAAPVAATTTASETAVAATTAADTVVASSVAAVVDDVAVASTSTSASSASSVCPDPSSATDYISTALYHHNIHRCNHSAPALTYSEELAGYAATLAATCEFHHNLSIGGVSYGQNIADYMGSGFDVEALGAESQVASSITDMWYNGELEAYPSDAYGQANPDFSDSDAWDHFSQLVWVDSTTVGCASQYCPEGELAAGWEGWFTVCNYQAEGNMGGEYGANVLPPLGHPVVTA